MRAGRAALSPLRFEGCDERCRLRQMEGGGVIGGENAMRGGTSADGQMGRARDRILEYRSRKSVGV